MINEFHVQNYKALRDVKLKLTPMHVLIGPNDSGKTSILEALGALCRSVEMPLEQALIGKWADQDLVSHGANESKVTLSVAVNQKQKDSSLRYAIDIRFGSSDVKVDEERVTFPYDASRNRSLKVNDFRTVASKLAKPNFPNADIDVFRAVKSALSPVQYFRWITRRLALPVVPVLNRQFQLEKSGFGLAQFVDDILSRDPRRFLEMEQRFCEIFQQVSAIQLERMHAYSVTVDQRFDTEAFGTGDGKGLYFETKPYGKRVSAFQVSDGMLLILAYLAMLYSPDPPKLLLIEEPENGIHPALLREVTNILRQLVEENEKTQVIMTTHSAYMVDLFQPEEVSLCVKDEHGNVKARRMSESPIVQRLMKTFTLGEIWTAEEDVVRAEALNGGVTVEP